MYPTRTGLVKDSCWRLLKDSIYIFSISKLHFTFMPYQAVGAVDLGLGLTSVPKSLQMVTADMKLQDAYSLEEKL